MDDLVNYVGGPEPDFGYQLKQETAAIYSESRDLRKRLEKEKLEHQAHIKRIDELFVLLDRNPDIEKILKLLR